MMKRFTFLFFIVLLSLNSIAQKVIQMKKDRGIYKMACNINGAKADILFDKDVPSVYLSEFMANYLYDNNFITNEDIMLGKWKRTNDSNGTIILLKDVKITSFHLKNVMAIIRKKQKVPLILGISALKKYGNVILDGDKLIIYD